MRGKSESLRALPARRLLEVPETLGLTLERAVNAVHRRLGGPRATAERLVVVAALKRGLESVLREEG